MNDRVKVYTQVLQTLQQQLRMFHQGHVVTLAMMITGIVLSGKAHLSQMSAEIPGSAKDQSLEMRMRRWVKHAEIDVEVTYLPIYYPHLLSGQYRVNCSPIPWQQEESACPLNYTATIVGSAKNSQLSI